MSKSILVTGGAGFIGSNFIPFFCNKYPNYKIVNLDKLTYAGNLDNLTECRYLPQEQYEFVQGDICDISFVQKIFKKYDVKGVIHFAAESHVDNSICGPRAFINTNIIGTFNLLETAYHHWMSSPTKFRTGYESARFHHISTDEVYGTLGSTGYFTEDTAYAPNSPYSSSKASSDLLVRSFFHTYGLNVTTSNCSNNYGPKQHCEKLIPKTITNCLTNREIPVYGNGLNIRDWLYVIDHCIAIDTVFHQGKAGETYNIGGNNELTNIALVKEICHILDQKVPRKDGTKYDTLIRFVQDRVGHDFRYAIDASKIKRELGWTPIHSFNQALDLTIDFYMERTK